MEWDGVTHVTHCEGGEAGVVNWLRLYRVMLFLGMLRKGL